MIRPVSTEGIRLKTEDTKIAMITRSIWNLYGASQEKTRFRSGQVTFGRFAFSSSVR